MNIGFSWGSKCLNTPLLAIKKPTLLTRRPIIFFALSHLFLVQYLFSKSVTLHVLVKVICKSFFKKVKPGQIARPMPIRRAQERKIPEARQISRAHIFCLVKKKNSFDLQISSQIAKTIKKLQWIPNAIVNTSVFVIFWCLHIWFQNWFIYSWIEKQLIACIRKDRSCYRALQISTKKFFQQNSNVNLSASAILAKVPFELPDWVENVLRMDTTQLLKFKQRYLSDSK